MVTNFYEKIDKKFRKDPYTNPNKCKNVPLHPFRMVLVGASGSGKSNQAMNLLLDCNAFEKIYLIAKQLDQPLYKFLIEKLELAGSKLKQKVLIASEDIKDLPNPDDLNPNIQNLIIIDDMILEKNLKPVEELYVRSRNKNCSVMFLSQSFHAIPKIIRLQSGYVMLRNIESKKDFKMMASNYELNRTSEELYKMYQKATSEPFRFFTVDLVTTNPSLKFRAGYAPIDDLDKQPQAKEPDAEPKKGGAITPQQALDNLFNRHSSIFVK
jgi:hypothetical protein